MKYKVTLNGKTYEVEVEAGKAMLLDEYEAVAPSAPAAAPAVAPAAVPAPAPAVAPVVTAAGDPVNAPMPGVIVRVEAAQGSAVKAGQIVAVLEAMKMENEILAPRDGTIAQVLISKGTKVDTGTPLFVLA